MCKKTATISYIYHALLYILDISRPKAPNKQRSKPIQVVFLPILVIRSLSVIRQGGYISKELFSSIFIATAFVRFFL